MAMGRVNPPDPLASMLAGLTINSNHRGDGGVGTRLLFPPGRKRNSKQQQYMEAMAVRGRLVWRCQMRDGGVPRSDEDG